MEELLITGVRFLGALPMFVVAACLVFFNRGKLQSVVYDRSRWFITAATLILGIHFAIQFVYQLREQSVTLCWTLNMMAYVIATPLYNMAELIPSLGVLVLTGLFAMKRKADTLYLAKMLMFSIGGLWAMRMFIVTWFAWPVLLFALLLIPVFVYVLINVFKKEYAVLFPANFKKQWYGYAISLATWDVLPSPSSAPLLYGWLTLLWVMIMNTTHIGKDSYTSLLLTFTLLCR